MAKPSNIRKVSVGSDHTNILVYGTPGSGKSYLAGTSPKALILEGGPGETKSIASAKFNVDVWEMNNRSDLLEAYEYMRHEGCKEYEWLWLDSISMLEGRLMEDQLEEAHASNNKRSLLVPSMPDYQIVQNTVDQYTKWFCKLPINFGMTAHVMIQAIKELDEDGDEVDRLSYLPQVQGGQGKLSQKICGYFDIVGYFDVEQKGKELLRSLMFQGDNTHVAKDRYGVLADDRGRMVSPTIPKISGLVAKAMGSEKPKPMKATGATKKGVAKKATSASKATAARR